MSSKTAAVPGKAVELPTLAVALVLYALFLLVTWRHQDLPWWALLALGGYLTAWHGSLQHEAIHGHPTRWPWVNRLLVFPNLWLAIPYDCYRESHLAHHRDENLTDPLADPESFYVTAAAWRRAGPLGRALLIAHNSLLGRLVLGPPLLLLRQGGELLRAVGSGERRALLCWLAHVPAVAVVLFWVIGVCGLPFWQYLLFFVYPGLALTLLRSFAEHRARPAVPSRTAVVKAEWPLALLFLNNNLHVAHHLQPGLPWYRLPAAWRALRTDLPGRPEQDRGEVFRGYWEIALRHLLWPKEPPLHPSERWRAAGEPEAGGMIPGTGEA